MTARHETSPPDSTASAEEWFVRLRREDPGADARLDFDHWLSASAENREAWQDLCAIWGDLGALRADDELLVIRQQALAQHDEGRGWGQWRVLAAAGMAAMLLIGAGLVWRDFEAADDRSSLAQTEAAPSHFINPVGKRSRILLADGSIVQLDADSALTISYTEHRRAIALERGRALFHVAKNPARPFVVTAAGRGVTALGTRFSVDIQQRAVRIVLDEGRVRVDDRRRGAIATVGHRVELTAGHMLLADERATWRPVEASTTQLLAWTNGQLLFDDQRLADVVTEVNRYSATQIVIVDAALADRRLSAVLKAGDVDTLLDGIVRLDLAQIVRVEPDRVELRARRGRVTARRDHNRAMS